MASRFKKTALRSPLWVLLSLIGLAQTLRAQPIQVLVNVNPPYSAYLQDYAGAGQQVQIRLINPSARALEIRLQGSVTGDNGVSIRTLPNYRPPVPFVLQPGTTLLTRKDLEGLFDLNQILVEGMNKNLLYQGKPLPEGSYQLCVQVFDNRTSQALSAGEPLGCSPPFPVKAIEPPILIAPFCDSEVMPTTPQATVFTWSPPAGVLPTQVSYTLRVVELPLQNVDPNVFIDAIALPPSGIEIKNLPTSTFLYGPQYLPLKVGKRYAWRVQAVDKFGKLNLLNDGKSPVCAFQYGPADTLKAPVLANAKSPISLSGLTELIFCGQTITVKKITNPDRDHFSGSGTLVMKSPVKLSAEVSFSDLKIRPLAYDQSQKRGKSGFYDFTVITGQLENSLKGAQVDDKTAKLKTDPHTGGTAAMTYQAIRLVANHSELFDEKLNSHRLQKGGSDEASIQTGLTWYSPITITTLTGYKPGKSGSFSPGTASFDGNLTVDVPGSWYPIASVGSELKKAPALKIPFSKAYEGPLSDLSGFYLNLRADSYFEIQNGRLVARLNGTVTVPSGRKEVAPLIVPFQESDGITFTAQIDDQQVPVSVVNDQARLFLRFQKLNVQLGDLFEAGDLPYPQWVKGVSCPEVEFWMRSGDYNNDKLDWTIVPINPVVNRGKGYESTNADRKGLNWQTKFLGFKGKITDAITVIKNSEFKVGHLVGQVYVPFVGSVGYLQIMIEKYGLGEADVISFDKSERTLLDTPAGDRIVVKTNGGYFADGYFYPDMAISAYNATNPTRGLDARDIRMDAIDVAITPKGELVSDYKNKKAEAYYSGSKQKTAYLNGLDYHLARVVLSDEAGGKQCRLSFNGKLVLGEKIVTDDQYLYDLVFAKPPVDDFNFTGSLPFSDPFPPTGTEGGGPSADGAETVSEAERAAGYHLERAAPASFLKPLKANTIHGSFSTGTAYYQGDFTLYTDDATFGNGFRLDTKALIFSPVNTQVGATVIAGKAQGVKYWFAAFKYESKDTPGISLFLNLEAYGFEGRIYSHMKHVGEPSAIFNDNYVPDAGTSFGLFAAMPIQSVADKGRLLWGKTGVELTFQGFAPKQITIRGDVNLEQLGGTGDASTSRVQGYGVIVMAPKEKTIVGTVNMTKGDFTAVCMTGTASFYMGPSGFAVSVGSPAQPVKATALCGIMGDLTPSATAYCAIYATNGSIGGMDWIPTSGIGIRAHLAATLLNIDTRKFFVSNPWATLTAGADADLDVTIRPSVDLYARVGTDINLNVGYSNYSYNLANVSESVQLTLPDFCLAYNKRICFPVLGGCNLIVGLRPTPYMRTNGGPEDMCRDDGTVQGPCEGILGWLMDGAQVIVNAAGEVLDTAYNLLKDATGAVVKGAEAVGGAIKDGYCSTIGWGC
ncbi:hypothetical protein [Larkinella rosea]|uniref:Uncharacterized protein n=1 Tax=Larkinella rosea TaxID=2025312 RepID=A0A3P1BUW1_9BACT|nr:hypothetical protein [Larkinella rosea]RRB04901.1 hypothetical protein EHT25_15700 [Larkinella rosea]